MESTNFECKKDFNMAKLLFFETYKQDTTDNYVNSEGTTVIDFPCNVIIAEILLVPTGCQISDRVPIKGR